MFSAISFMISKTEVQIPEKNMSQPLNFWDVVLAFPRHKKTPIYKFIIKNLDNLKVKHKRNHVGCKLEDTMRGGGTCKSWRKTLADTPLIDENALIVSNKFNSFLNTINIFFRERR